MIPVWNLLLEAALVPTGLRVLAHENCSKWLARPRERKYIDGVKVAPNLKERRWSEVLHLPIHFRPVLLP